MLTKKILCFVLVATLIAGISGLALNTSEVSAQGLYDAFTIGRDLVAIASGGFNIANFFLGGGPDPAVMEKLNEINDRLIAIQKSLDEIKKELSVIYSEIQKVKEYDILQTAWGTIGYITEKYRDLQEFYENPPTTQTDFNTRKAQFEAWVKQVLPDGPGGMDVAVNDWYQALVTPLPGADGSALDIATNLAILSCDTNTPSQDFSARVESTNGVPIIAERPMYFNYNRELAGGHTEGGVTEPASRFFFAEGTTRPDFDTYFSIMNPGEDLADVKLTYMKGDSTVAEQTLSVPPHTRSTVRADDFLGSSDDVSCDFSTVIESTNGVDILAERPTYFSYQGNWYGGTVNSGCTDTSQRFFFAEGTTRPNFETYFCIMNPGGDFADVKLTYMKGDGTVAEQTLSVPPHTRSTVRANDFLGSAEDVSCDFSAVVESTNGVPIVAERPMYFNYKGQYTGGHSETGIVEPAEKFYLAEGTTRPDFDTYLCIMNPGGDLADVKLTYMKGDSTVAEQTLSVPPHTRSTVRANDFLGSTEDVSCDFSAVIESTNGVPIVAERPMYFNYKGFIDGGSCEPGTTEMATLLHFAEGTVRDNFDSYLCLQNPGDEASQVKITYMKGDANIQEQVLMVPAHTRTTVSVDQVYDAPNDLEGVYKTYLESLFWGSFTYQALGARMICEALEKDPSLLPWGKDYMSKRFNPEIVGPEVDKFLSSVERLVMSQIYIGPDNLTKPSLSDPGYRFADKTDEVLKRANFFASQAMGQPEGLRGTMFATESVGGVTEVTAGGKAPAGITTTEVPYTVKSPDGMGVVEKRYPNWTGAWDSGQLSTSNKFCVVRYNFSNITEPGTYDIIDTAGHLVDPGTAFCQGQVEDMALQDPSDPGKVVHAKFGHFLTLGQRLGPEFMCALSVVELKTDVPYPSSSAALAEPFPDYRYRLWSHVKIPGAHNYASAYSVRNITFNDTEDRNVTIRVFLNLGMYVNRGSKTGEYSHALYRVWLHDKTTDEMTLIYQHLLEVSYKGSHETEYKQDGCRDDYAKMNATLKAGHQYDIQIESMSDVDSTPTGYGSWDAASDLLITGVYLEIAP